MDVEGQLSLSFSKSNGQPGDHLVLTFVCQGSDSIDAVTFFGLIGKDHTHCNLLKPLYIRISVVSDKHLQSDHLATHRL